MERKIEMYGEDKDETAVTLGTNRQSRKLGSPSYYPSSFFSDNNKMSTMSEVYGYFQVQLCVII